MNKPLAIVAGFTASVVAAGIFACTDIPTSATAILSLQFDSLPPSVVVGDTLRDTTGAILFPSVHAFNYSGDEILPSPVYFLSPDTGVTVDSATGLIIADSLRSTPARIVASAGTLQAVQRINLTLRPDLIAPVHAFDSVLYSVIDSVDVSDSALTIKLSHGVASNDSAVKSYIVSFEIVSQPELAPGTLVNDAGKPSFVDTTDASGIAGRKISLHPVRLNSATQVDSIIVNATAKYRGVPVAGSPVRLVMLFKPKA